MLIIIPGAAMDPVWRNCSAAEANWALSAWSWARAASLLTGPVPTEALEGR